jgi:GntR family transcriptional repressor for pyruvate dehydrogenase complex
VSEDQNEQDWTVRRSVPDEIRDALIASMDAGTLAPGAQLPPERALCEQFGVSRASVRQAIQGLVTLGRVGKRGNRLYVLERFPEVRIDAQDVRKYRVRELFEVRRVVEIAITSLAAGRASSVERSEIQALGGSFHDDMPLADFRESDRLFHWTIARACGNPTLVEIYGKVLDAVFASEEFRSLLGSTSNVQVVRRVIADSAAAHRRIGDAVAAGDADAAATASQQHLDEVERHMISNMV